MPAVSLNSACTEPLAHCSGRKSATSAFFSMEARHMNAQDIISILNDLIKVSEDGEKGFAEAAEIATDSKLKTLFTASSRECANSIAELQQLVTTLGGSAK